MHYTVENSLVFAHVTAFYAVRTVHVVGYARGLLRSLLHSFIITTHNCDVVTPCGNDVGESRQNLGGTGFGRTYAIGLGMGSILDVLSLISVTVTVYGVVVVIYSWTVAFRGLVMTYSGFCMVWNRRISFMLLIGSDSVRSSIKWEKKKHLRKRTKSKHNVHWRLWRLPIAI